MTRPRAEAHRITFKTDEHDRLHAARRIVNDLPVRRSAPGGREGHLVSRPMAVDRLTTGNTREARAVSRRNVRAAFSALIRHGVLTLDHREARPPHTAWYRIDMTQARLKGVAGRTDHV